MAEASTKPKAATKSQMYQTLADKTELSKKQVQAFFDALTEYIEDQLGKKGPGVVNINNLLKVKKVVKPATKARPGRNPLTGQEIMIPAKPKRTVVKAQPLKALKDMAGK